MVVNFCPLTGAKLCSQLDWENVTFGQDFSVSYKIIERNILLCTAVGSGNLEGLKKSQRFGLAIINISCWILFMVVPAGATSTRRGVRMYCLAKRVIFSGMVAEKSIV